MTVDKSFMKVISGVRKIVEADGVIDLGETPSLLRISRVFAARTNTLKNYDVISLVKYPGK